MFTTAPRCLRGCTLAIAVALLAGCTRSMRRTLTVAAHIGDVRRMAGP
ncbi:MAG: hypothetical protein ACJ74F_04115 [Mycobacterium sp.]